MRKKLTAETAEAAFGYSIYKKKFDELQNFLNKEVVLWGGYPNIPNYIKKLVDKELLAIGRYAKRIDARAMESDAPPSVN